MSATPLGRLLREAVEQAEERGAGPVGDPVAALRRRAGLARQRAGALAGLTLVGLVLLAQLLPAAAFGAQDLPAPSAVAPVAVAAGPA